MCLLVVVCCRVIVVVYGFDCFAVCRLLGCFVW